NGAVSVLDYGAALTKSLLYYEAQRSGKLPPNQRVQWRGDSGLKVGSDAQIDLGGGYYDAGDNVKFGFPMAFTVTMLAWSSVEFQSQLEAKNELSNALDTIKWGTDYFFKAHPQPDVLYDEVGDGDSDHSCWERAEEMTTPRTTFKIDDHHPGADLAAETAAALAAASIAFKPSNPTYATELINHAKQLFEFARNHPGQYQNSIPVAGKFYSSSGYEADYKLGSNPNNMRYMWLDSDQTTPAATPTVPAAAAPARKQEDHPQILTKETKVKSKQKAGLGTYRHRQSFLMCDHPEFSEFF
ncbi:LOW QUALITY PROTEIN: endoglucanase 13-like, partial [Populus nigra]|uniref:LOW QUALITY PROTEIN: endoglucanase 13-like n=1 Tax=Populus nigra TaxID=3691 RepID=UPI002B267244